MKYANYIISLLSVAVAVVIIALFYHESLSFDSTIVILLGEIISMIAILFHVKSEKIMETTVVEKHIADIKAMAIIPEILFFIFSLLLFSFAF